MLTDKLLDEGMNAMNGLRLTTNYSPGYTHVTVMRITILHFKFHFGSESRRGMWGQPPSAVRGAQLRLVF